jgi:hypothetical protein
MKTDKNIHFCVNKCNWNNLGMVLNWSGLSTMNVTADSRGHCGTCLWLSDKIVDCICTPKINATYCNKYWFCFENFGIIFSIFRASAKTKLQFYKTQRNNHFTSVFWRVQGFSSRIEVNILVLFDSTSVNNLNIAVSNLGIVNCNKLTTSHWSTIKFTIYNAQVQQY